MERGGGVQKGWAGAGGTQVEMGSAGRGPPSRNAKQGGGENGQQKGKYLENAWYLRGLLSYLWLSLFFSSEFRHHLHIDAFHV